MTLTVNGEPTEAPEGTTVEQLLRQLGRDPEQQGTAVARNLDVIPRSAYGATQLQDGDRVDLVVAVGGG